MAALPHKRRFSMIGLRPCHRMGSWRRNSGRLRTCGRASGGLRGRFDRPRGQHGRAAPRHRGGGRPGERRFSVILLTDMFGARRRTWRSRSWIPAKVEVVAGVSLPMLIKLMRAGKRRSRSGGGLPGAGCRTQIHQRRFERSRTDERAASRSGHCRSIRRGLASPAPPRALSNALKASTARSRLSRDSSVGGTSIMGLMTLAAASARPSTCRRQAHRRRRPSLR